MTWLKITGIIILLPYYFVYHPCINPLKYMMHILQTIVRFKPGSNEDEVHESHVAMVSCYWCFPKTIIPLKLKPSWNSYQTCMYFDNLEPETSPVTTRDYSMQKRSLMNDPYCNSEGRRFDSCQGAYSCIFRLQKPFRQISPAVFTRDSLAGLAKQPRWAIQYNRSAFSNEGEISHTFQAVSKL